MSIVLLVYLASIVRDLCAALSFMAIAGVIGLSTYTLGMCIDYKKTVKELGVKKWFALCFIMFFTAVFIPSEKAIYVMAGASIAQDIANSPKTAVTMDKVYKIIDSKLEEQLEAVSKKAEKKIEESVK